MDQNPLQGIDVALPRLLREYVLAVGMAGIPAGLDPRPAEVDVLGVVFAVELRR